LVLGDPVENDWEPLADGVNVVGGDFHGPQRFNHSIIRHRSQYNYMTAKQQVEVERRNLALTNLDSSILGREIFPHTKSGAPNRTPQHLGRTVSHDTGCGRSDRSSRHDSGTREGQAGAISAGLGAVVASPLLLRLGETDKISRGAAWAIPIGAAVGGAIIANRIADQYYVNPNDVLITVVP
jgi:hypothetical protein